MRTELTREQTQHIAESRRLGRKTGGPVTVAFWDLLEGRWLTEFEGFGSRWVGAGAPIVRDGIRYKDVVRELTMTIRERRDIEWERGDGTTAIEGRIESSRRVITADDFPGRLIIARLDPARARWSMNKLIQSGATILEENWRSSREWWEWPEVTEEMRLQYSACVIN